jgi:hypothetical protein
MEFAVIQVRHLIIIFKWNLKSLLAIQQNRKEIFFEMDLFWNVCITNCFNFTHQRLVWKRVSSCLSRDVLQINFILRDLKNFILFNFLNISSMSLYLIARICVRQVVYCVNLNHCKLWTMKFNTYCMLSLFLSIHVPHTCTHSF